MKLCMKASNSALLWAGTITELNETYCYIVDIEETYFRFRKTLLQGIDNRYGQKNMASRASSTDDDFIFVHSLSVPLFVLSFRQRI